MPTKKPLKKAKRVNWKAEHSVMEQERDYWETRTELLEDALVRVRGEFNEARTALDGALKRATDAEKHNAILLAERETWSFAGDKLTEQDKRDLMAWWEARQSGGLFHVEQKAKPADDEDKCPWPNTCPMCLWQRLKAWVWG